MYGGRKGVLELMKRTVSDDAAADLTAGQRLDMESDTDYHSRYIEINYGRNRAERRRSEAMGRQKYQNKTKKTRRKSNKRTNKRPAGN